MNYIELKLTVPADFADILTAELAELGFESFVETDEGLDAYIEEARFEADAVRQLAEKYAEQAAIAYQVSSLEKRNWNEEWERDYQPIEVGQVRVRASFHQPDERFRYDIVINPKMSFGTGHHETTAMMLQHQQELDVTGKAVMDVGSGTGILAIMAARQGASRVLAFDVEEWAVENAVENAALNGCPQIMVFLGTIDSVAESERFDLVLANINRNVLLDDIPAYATRLTSGATLLVSGFYETDAPDITKKAEEAGLVRQSQLTRNNWASLRFLKP